MNISTQTSYLGQLFGDVEAIKLLARAGFKHIDYSMFYMNDPECPLHSIDYMRHVEHVKQTALEYGISFNQTHAFFPSVIEGNTEFNKLAFDYIIRSIEITAYLGAPYVVIHPSHFKESIYENNFEFFKQLIPYAKEYNIKIAIENSIGLDICCEPDSHIRLIDELNQIEDCFVALLDVGHAELGTCLSEDYINHLGSKRLKCLHIHDNNLNKDEHQLPFTRKLDWNSITRALADVEYTGDLTFEADKFLRLFPFEMVEDASRFMFKVGKQLVKMIERHKEK